MSLRNIATLGLTQVLKVSEAAGLKLNRKIQAMAARICDGHRVKWTQTIKSRLYLKYHHIKMYQN